MSDSILLQRNQGIAIITLNRSEARNAFTQAMLSALRATLRSLAGDPAIRCVVLQAEGSCFSVGGDIREFARMLRLPQDEKDAAFAAVLDDAQAISLLIRSLPQPVVAAVQGAAAGFGFSLALAADFTLAAVDSIFVAAYGSLGASPDGGLSLLLTSTVGFKRAAEILMLNRALSAEQAHELALIHQVIQPDNLAASALELAYCLANCSTNAICRSKQLITLAGQRKLEKQLAAERQHFLQSINDRDFSEGIAAFIAKRPARFNTRGEQA